MNIQTNRRPPGKFQIQFRESRFKTNQIQIQSMADKEAIEREQILKQRENIKDKTIDVSLLYL